MGGGGASETNPVIPQELLALFSDTSSQLRPLQKQMWTGEGWRTLGGAKVSAEQQATIDAAQTSIANAQATLGISAPNTSKGSEAYKAWAIEHNAARTALESAQNTMAAYQPSPSKFTEDQSWDKYFGKDSANPFFIPEEWDAAKAQLGASTAENSYGKGARGAYTDVFSQAENLKPYMNADYTKKIAGLNAAHSELGDYIGQSWGKKYDAAGNVIPGSETQYIPGARRPGEELAATGLMGQAVDTAGKTSTLRGLAESTGAVKPGQADNLVGNMMSVWGNTKLPTLQNQASRMGLGRATGTMKAFDSSQNQFLLPVVMNQQQYENEAIGRKAAAQQAAGGQQMAAAQSAAQREQEDFQRKLYAADRIQSQQQQTYDAAQAEQLRKQALGQEYTQTGLAAKQAAGAGLAGMSAAQQQAQQGAAQQWQAMAGKSIEAQMLPGQFNYQDFLRQQGLGENSLFQPLGGMASTIGSKTSGGGK
jgi:hypothetical protein